MECTFKARPLLWLPSHCRETFGVRPLLWFLSKLGNCVSEVRQGVDPPLDKLYFYWESVNVVRSAHSLHNGLKGWQQLSIWLGFRSWMTIVGCCGLASNVPQKLAVLFGGGGCIRKQGLVGKRSLGVSICKVAYGPKSSPALLTWPLWNELRFTVYPPFMVTTLPWPQSATVNGLWSLKPWTKIQLSLFKLFLSGVLPQTRVANTCNFSGSGFT